MNVVLERIDLRGLALDLAMGEATDERRIAVVRTAERLRGELRSGGGRLSITGLSAARVDLASLDLDFGTVELVASDEGGDEGSARLAGLSGRYAQDGARLRLDLEASEVFAARLEVRVLDPDVRVSGRVRIQGMKLAVDDGEGRVDGAVVTVDDFRLVYGDLELAAPRLEAREMSLGWGGAFRLEAQALASPALSLRMPGAELSASALSVESARLDGGEVDVARATAGALGLKLALSEGEKPSPEPTAPPPPPMLDLRMLDGVDGELNVDLFVDLSVPVIGSRRATHRFRIAVREGSLDFLALERDLSALESALLDFALRSDGTLVLELGIPLLPTRGRGKPIVVWDLSPEDRALAERNRVRLALLPALRLAGERPDRPDELSSREESTFALRKLEFGDLAAQLSLRPVPALRGPLRDLEARRVGVRGEIHYDPSTPAREGEANAEVEGAALAVHGLPLGDQALDVGRLVLERANVRVAFLGVRPASIQGELEGVALEKCSVRPRDGVSRDPRPNEDAAGDAR